MCCPKTSGKHIPRLDPPKTNQIEIHVFGAPVRDSIPAVLQEQLQEEDAVEQRLVGQCRVSK